MKCTNCGYEIKENASFCGYCGHNISKPGPQKDISTKVGSSGFNSIILESARELTLSKMVFYLALLLLLFQVMNLMGWTFGTVALGKYIIRLSIVNVLVNFLLFFITLRISFLVSITFFRRSIFWITLLGLIFYIIYIIRIIS